MTRVGQAARASGSGWAPAPFHRPAGPALASKELPAYLASSTDAAQVAGAASIAATPAASPAVARRAGVPAGSRAITIMMIAATPAATVLHSAQGRKPLWADHSQAVQASSAATAAGSTQPRRSPAR